MIPRVVEFNLGLKKRLRVVKKEYKYNGLILYNISIDLNVSLGE